MNRSVLRGTAAAALFAAWFAWGCATPKPITTWWYSDWTSKVGAGKGAFEDARNACLAKLGISDPAAVESNSPEETRFLECMNAANWCTNAYGCNKPPS